MSDLEIQGSYGPGCCPRRQLDSSGARDWPGLSVHPFGSIRPLYLAAPNDSALVDLMALLT